MEKEEKKVSEETKVKVPTAKPYKKIEVKMIQKLKHLQKVN